VDLAFFFVRFCGFDRHIGVHGQNARTNCVHRVWDLPNYAVTPEANYLRRREFLRVFASPFASCACHVGILKNIIVDHFRKLGREISFTDMDFLSDEFSEKFVSVGFWNHDLGPHEWKPEPDEVMNRAEFWQVMRECLSKLPEKIRAVFTMREMDGVPRKEVCAVLSISDSYLWVMLHRARMALRECLEMNWFDTPAGGTA
jgi:RNA polymerase sigma-70 factor (TIGR02943 family)